MNIKYALFTVLVTMLPACFAAQPALKGKHFATQELVEPGAKKVKRETSTQQNNNLANNTASASNSSATSEEEKDSYYIKMQTKYPGYQMRHDVSIKLYKIGKTEAIGESTAHYAADGKIELCTIDIDPEYRKSHLGSYLFKYTMAAMVSLKDNLSPTSIEWVAAADISDDATSYEKRFKQIVKFYCDQGSIDKETADIKKYKMLFTDMYYPVPRAQMLATLMPILEPVPVSQQDKQITLASGATYQAGPHDALGIIANYMTENNE
jgi:hypothetical protein